MGKRNMVRSRKSGKSAVSKKTTGIKNPPFLRVEKIAAKLVKPLRKAHAAQKTLDAHARVKAAAKAEAERHAFRSDAAVRAWVTIRANRMAEVSSRLVKF